MPCVRLVTARAAGTAHLSERGGQKGLGDLVQLLRQGEAPLQASHSRRLWDCLGSTHPVPTSVHDIRGLPCCLLPGNCIEMAQRMQRHLHVPGDAKTNLATTHSEQLTHECIGGRVTILSRGPRGCLLLGVISVHFHVCRLFSSCHNGMAMSQLGCPTMLPAFAWHTAAFCHWDTLRNALSLEDCSFTIQPLKIRNMHNGGVVACT